VADAVRPAPGAAEGFDVVVVGAGPAGSAAALTAARGGLRVCLLERGPYPGAKNMYGGVVYPRVLDGLIPQWWEQMPIQRWITRRATMLATPSQALTIDYRTEAWGRPPYNGATALRSELDGWLAQHAVAAGATLVTSTTVTGLLRDVSGRITGVRTDRPDGELRAALVIACDGVNSFLAKEAGLYADFSADNITLGAKEVLALPREQVEARFGLSGRDGLDIEMVGVTGRIPGGGFLYTNLDSVAVGVVVSVRALAEARMRPEELIAGVKAHPAIAPYLRGAVLREYSAHTIPEGGYDTMPGLSTDGMLVAGDAAAMCLAAGIWLEGVNFALGAGAAAGETAVEAVAAGDTTARGLAGYRRRLDAGFVLPDHRKLRRAPHLVLSDRVQNAYPQLACDLVEEMFTVTNPEPKKGAVRLLRAGIKRRGLRWRELARDGISGLRTYG
jgi:electron transfer flavoprotein-quinone oxidoreductase